MEKRKIIKDGKEYEYGETTFKEDTTLNLRVPDPLEGVDEEKIEEYKKSPQWKELDDLFLKVADNKGNTKELLQKIVSYGEIAAAKHGHDLFNLLESRDSQPIDLMILPYFFRMPIPHAINFLERRYSDNEETEIKAAIELNELFKDENADFLIGIIENSGKANDREVTMGTMGELFRMGEVALPQIKIELTTTENPQLQMDLVFVALSIIFNNEERAFNLIKQIQSEDENISDKANEELVYLINNINLESYLLRHPELVQ
ncbi:MAG: hypothetical protein LBU40_01490 [Methanobrevibacter sp.]|jgi:hypothetical protein|nr:hypothetical protein [Methanobrevibacter sp.]